MNNSLKVKLLSCLFILLCTSSVVAQYPIVNATHPRLYADLERINVLKNGILVSGEMQNTFNDVLYMYNTGWITDPQLYVSGTDSTLWHWNWNDPTSRDHVFICVLIFKLTDDPLELKRCRFIVRQAIDIINNTNWSSMSWDDKETLIRKLSDAGDLMLDWLYDDLPISLRNDLEQALYAMNSEFMSTYIYSSAGNSYVSSHNTWNTIFANQNALVLYNATSLNTAQKDTVQQWYQDVYDKIQNGFIPCWTYYRDDDGGWNWGAAYAMWSLVDQFQLFENMRIGTDKNFFTDLPWIENSINQYLYFIQPNNQTLHLGDGEMTLMGDRVIYLHAIFFNDPRSKWLAQNPYTPSTITKQEKLLYKDFSMPSVSHHNAPLQWWADKVGLSVSFSSWEPDATMVTFFNSPSKRAAHEHRDNNSFTVFKHKPLLIDAGYYDAYNSIHYRNYYQRTIAHNSICVFDDTETYFAFGNEVSNDGGQIESDALMNINDITAPENQRGKWIHYAANDAYTYNVADAQLSYNNNKLDFFRRKLLYLPPNKIIVLDHIHLKNTATQQRDIQWTGHFVNQPQITGEIINTTIPEHILTYNGKDYTATNGNGTVALRTLLPLETNTTLIGGNGYEYWVNGINYPTQTNPDPNDDTYGSWRIEVRPNNVTDSIVFLHTIQTGDNVNIAVAEGIALTSNVSIGIDWTNTLYFFAADAGIEKTCHLLDNVAGNRTLTLFATDLQSGNYTVKVNGVTHSTEYADVDGILTCTISLTDDNNTIEITKETTTNGIPEIENSIIIYPNPTTGELHILSNEYQIVSIDMFDILGCSVIRQSGLRQSEITINISNILAGTYFLKIETEQGTIMQKVVKR